MNRNRQLLLENPLYEQWAYLSLYENGCEWETKQQKEDAFARNSKKLLQKLKEAA